MYLLNLQHTENRFFGNMKSESLKSFLFSPCLESGGVVRSIFKPQDLLRSISFVVNSVNGVQMA